MAYTIVNGIRFHYEVAGDGDPVLLINGLGSPAVSWALQVKALASHYRVITFDNRGIGETDLPPDPAYATAQMADDAAALARQLKVERAHVMGASMGGTIAQELALRHPKLVRSLVLACTWTEADARFLHTIEAWVGLVGRVPIEERYRHVLYPWLYSPKFFETRHNIETAFQRALAYPHQSKPEAIARQARGIVAWNGTRTKRLGDIKAPTLVLVGKDDILTPPAFSKAVAKGIKKARMVVLPGGHGFSLEEAELFNRTVLRFLKSVRAK
jgi:pimeloyl-ACP methyl ester carboxylesterase